MTRGLGLSCSDNDLKLTVEVAVPTCKDTKNYSVVHFKWVNDTVWILVSKKLFKEEKKSRTDCIRSYRRRGGGMGHGGDAPGTGLILGDGMFWNYGVVTATQLCEYTEIH